jgi:hypothetical protein
MSAATVQFAEEYPLWDVTYSDLIRIDRSATPRSIVLAVKAARQLAGKPHYYWDARRRSILTLDQVFVELLCEELRTSEIAFHHTHIPRNIAEHDR